MRGCGLRTVHPSAFSGLTLKWLDLSYNRLEGLNVTWADNATVDMVDLTHNALTELPVTVPATELVVNQNVLTTAQFVHPAVQSLNISSNILQNIGKLVLQHVVSLSISYNPLQLLPSGGMAQGTHRFDISHTNIRTWPTDLFSQCADTLVSVNARGVGISVFPAALTKTTFRALTILELTDNALSQFPDDVFAFYPALKELHLSSNPLRSLEPGLFAALTALETLSLRQTQLKTFPASKSVVPTLD